MSAPSATPTVAREGSLSFVFSDGREACYKRLVTSADGRRLLGAVLVGDCSDYDTLLQYFLNAH